MRFNWRRRLVVTAFAAASLLPFTGCSSQQQQQATEEVAAEEGQGGEGEGGNAEANAENANANTAGENTANTEGEGVQAGGGEDVVANNATASANTDASTNGDLKEIISEMSTPAEGAVAAQGEPAEGAEAAPAAPTTNGTAVANAAPASAPEAAPAAQPAGAEAAAAVPGLPELGSKMAYVVEPGDTLGKIAAKVFGDQKRWRDIAGLSGLENPNHIYPGDLVYYSLDDSSKGFAANYESIRRSKEIVRQGDTLASIAKRIYGKSHLWKHIWRQNDNINNPDELAAGMTVYYVTPEFIKTAFNKIKDSTTKTINASTKKLNKSIHLMTQISIAMPTIG